METVDVMETVEMEEIVVEIMETVEMEEIVLEIMETVEMEEIVVKTMETVGMEEMMVEIMETMEVEETEEIMETTEETEAVGEIRVMEEEIKSRDTQESMAQSQIPTKAKITWMITALLQTSMELLLHQSMASMVASQASMGTEATNLQLREVTIPPLGEVTIQRRCAVINRLRRDHTEVMDRTEATPQRGVTTRPPLEATIQPPRNTNQRPNQKSMNHLRPLQKSMDHLRPLQKSMDHPRHHQRSMEDPRSMGSSPDNSMQNRFKINDIS